MGGAILDLDEPSKVLYRSRYYLLTRKDYETTGFVTNVVFPAQRSFTTTADGDYYGAPTLTALAFARIEECRLYNANSERVEKIMKSVARGYGFLLA